MNKTDVDVLRVVAKMIDLEGYKDSARTLYDIADRLAVDLLPAATTAVWAAMHGTCTHDLVCKSEPCTCAIVFARAALTAGERGET